MKLLVLVPIIFLLFSDTSSSQTYLNRPKTPKNAKIAVLVAVHSYCSDPKLALAIIRIESNFQNRIRLDEDSTGYMQVRPGTAKYLRCRAQTKNQLLDMNLNIECGCFLLGKNNTRYTALSDKISAYNAGSARICKTGTLYPSGKKCTIGKYINQDYVDQVLSAYNN